MSNTADTSKTAKKLETVRALLAKASDPTIGSAEAEAFRAKADALMTAYAIEQWQVDQAQSGVNKTAAPERRMVSIKWYDHQNNVTTEALWQMMQVVSHHCRVVVVARAGYSTVDKMIPVIGVPSDLDYFDMLFTDLMLQLGMRLTPKVDTDKSWEDNLVTLKEAGMNWKPIAEALIAAGQIEGPWTRNLGVRFTKVYSDYCKAHGREQLKITPRVFQRSFAEGFSVEVRARLRAMAREQEAQDTTGSYLPALRDIRQQADTLANELYPPEQGVYGKAVSTNYSTDPGAKSAGISAGRQANLSGHHGRRVGGQGALNA